MCLRLQVDKFILECGWMDDLLTYRSRNLE